MNTLLEQSRGYADLGMLEEAHAAALEALRHPGHNEAIREWILLLTYLSGDFSSAAVMGRELLASGNKRTNVYSYTALALHHVGQSKDAAALLLGFPEESRDSIRSYLIACFLAAAGDSDGAVCSLLTCLPASRNERDKTWLDGDLKNLWANLARGHFSLETAGRLIEAEFDELRRWEPDRGTNWNLDQSNYRSLPAELRAVMRFDPRIEGHVLDYSKAPPGSRRAEEFEQWAHCEVRSNQERFDCARSIAWERVLDAQPEYAMAAWRHGDVCAARHHIAWAVENHPALLSEFHHLPELAPLVDEMARMIDADPDFFAKRRLAHRLCKNEPQEALDILDAFDEDLRNHPLLTPTRGICLENTGNPIEGLRCVLCACDQRPNDASYFLNAMAMALRHGWKEIASAVMARAPEATRRHQGWRFAEETLAGKAPSYVAPLRDFRGQPDLGGMIIEECGVIRSQSALSAA